MMWLTDARRSERLWTFAAFVVGLLVLGMAAYLAFWIVGPMGWDFGQDYRFYRDLGARFLADGSYYLPHQLDGPYPVTVMVDVLYPPPALFLFVPFAVLPAFLWWAIPIGVTLYVLRWLRPTPWAVFAMLVLMLWPGAIGSYLFGNTDIWAVAGIAGGFRWGWPAILLLLKPTLAPFVLAGYGHRSWWVGGLALAAASLLLVPQWFDYARAMTNVIVDPRYSLGSIPLLLVPVMAWAGRARSLDRQGAESNRQGAESI